MAEQPRPRVEPVTSHALELEARHVVRQEGSDEALRESETRYRLLFQNMLDGFAYCRMLFDELGRPEDFVYLDVNGAFARLTGLHDVVGRRVSEVIPGIRESEPGLFEIYGRVARTGQAERFEFHFRPLEMWLSMSVYSPQQDHFVAVFDNITDRKRSEHALRESEEKYRTLFTSVTEGFTLNRAIHDASGRLHDLIVVEANPAAEKFNGLKREQLVGKTWRELWPGAEQYWWDMCNHVLLEGTDVQYENYAQVHDRWYRVHQFRVSSDLMGSIFSDITASKHAEQQLSRASRLKDDFLSMASHELRTPLTTLKLQAQSLARVLRREHATSDQIERKLGIVDSQLDRLDALVRMLLDVSRISAGRLALDRSQVDLSEIAREVVERFAPDGEPGASQLRLSARQLVGHWDRMRVDQVFTNLVDNAIKYGMGQPIDVTLEERDGAAIFAVRDRGIGIAPENQARIFERFERADDGTAASGLGLGLWIAREMVHAHGGQISVESTPGAGATFTVALPRCAP